MRGIVVRIMATLSPFFSTIDPMTHSAPLAFPSALVAKPNGLASWRLMRMGCFFLAFSQSLSCRVAGGCGLGCGFGCPTLCSERSGRAE